MSKARDPLAEACGSVALVLALNKPVYPLYIWFLTESAFQISLLTALSMPFYIAVWWLARRGKSFPARLGMVAVGTVDTIFIAFVLGGESGTLIFLFACIMLAGIAFHAREVWLSRGLIGLIFILFVALYGRIGAPIRPVSPEDMQTLDYLNTTGAAALAAFIALRFFRSRAATVTPPA
ncbi:hypothetical protein K7H91_19770 [Martelella mediterranea]|uniref:hypothetical protein n=1 Tax=Martelella mediterranea TaxID=293089 RepID=UPI001E4BE835|nr:hypothetical protein [Martelella mediterranea]MCD1636002.1 hypothetical protein [Martelella mediterranea]